MKTKVNTSLVGERFTRLKVIKQAEDHVFPNGATGVRYLCKCKCGNTKIVLAASLKNNGTKSCGCIRKETTIARNKSNKVDYKSTPEYSCYLSMRARCLNPDKKDYPRYGGRGIKICKRWRKGEGKLNGFQCFFEDMGPLPKPGYQIDRIDNEGNYKKSNCRWVTNKENANNRRSNMKITFKGKTQSLSSWVTELGLKENNTTYKRIHRRIKLGWTPKKAFSNTLRVNQYG